MELISRSIYSGNAKVFFRFENSESIVERKRVAIALIFHIDRLQEHAKEDIEYPFHNFHHSIHNRRCQGGTPKILNFSESIGEGLHLQLGLFFQLNGVQKHKNSFKVSTPPFISITRFTIEDIRKKEPKMLMF